MLSFESLKKGMLSFGFAQVLVLLMSFGNMPGFCVYMHAQMVVNACFDSYLHVCFWTKECETS